MPLSSFNRNSYVRRLTSNSGSISFCSFLTCVKGDWLELYCPGGRHCCWSSKRHGGFLQGQPLPTVQPTFRFFKVDWYKCSRFRLHVLGYTTTKEKHIYIIQESQFCRNHGQTRRGPYTLKDSEHSFFHATFRLSTTSTDDILPLNNYFLIASSLHSETTENSFFCCCCL